MKIEIGRRSDVGIQDVIRMNQAIGYTVFLEEHPHNEEADRYLIEVLNQGNTYRAPDAEFRPMPSGTYIFRDGKALFVGALQQ